MDTTVVVSEASSRATNFFATILEDPQNSKSIKTLKGSSTTKEGIVKQKGSEMEDGEEANEVKMTTKTVSLLIKNVNLCKLDWPSSCGPFHWINWRFI